jgi:hypothetical protein
MGAQAYRRYADPPAQNDHPVEPEEPRCVDKGIVQFFATRARASDGGIRIMRLSNLTLACLLVGVTTALAQQFPPQPAAPDRGNETERATCRPDVVKFCQAELHKNQDDVFTILACLQSNRAKISTACQQVLADHGQ